MEPYIKKLAGFIFLHLCTVDVKAINEDKNFKLKTVKYDIEQTMTFVSQIFDWLNEFCDKYTISEKVNNEQSDFIRNSFL